MCHHLSTSSKLSLSCKTWYHVHIYNLQIQHLKTTCTFYRRPFGVEQEYFVQLFVERDDSLKLPTVGDLLSRMFREQKIRFTKVCVCICMHACLCACMCVHVPTCMCDCVYESVCIVCMHTCTCTQRKILRHSGWAWLGRGLWPYQTFWLPHQRNMDIEGMGGPLCWKAWREHWYMIKATFDIVIIICVFMAINNLILGAVQAIDSDSSIWTWIQNLPEDYPKHQTRTEGSADLQT